MVSAGSSNAGPPQVLTCSDPASLPFGQETGNTALAMRIASPTPTHPQQQGR